MSQIDLHMGKLTAANNVRLGRCAVLHMTVPMFKKNCTLYRGGRIVNVNEKKVLVLVTSRIWKSIGGRKLGPNFLSPIDVHMVLVAVTKSNFRRCRPKIVTTVPMSKKEHAEYGSASTFDGDEQHSVVLPVVTTKTFSMVTVTFPIWSSSRSKASGPTLLRKCLGRMFLSTIDVHVVMLTVVDEQLASWFASSTSAVAVFNRAFIKYLVSYIVDGEVTNILIVCFKAYYTKLDRRQNILLEYFLKNTGRTFYLKETSIR